MCIAVRSDRRYIDQSRVHIPVMVMYCSHNCADGNRKYITLDNHSPGGRVWMS